MNLILRMRASSGQLAARPVASSNPMPPAGHDRLPGATLAGMVAYVSDRGFE